MSRKIEIFEQLQSVYPTQVATSDSTWAYLHSFNVRPFNHQDLDAPSYKLSGSA